MELPSYNNDVFQQQNGTVQTFGESEKEKEADLERGVLTDHKQSEDSSYTTEIVSPTRDIPA